MSSPRCSCTIDTSWLCRRERGQELKCSALDLSSTQPDARIWIRINELDFHFAYTIARDRRCGTWELRSLDYSCSFDCANANRHGSPLARNCFGARRQLIMTQPRSAAALVISFRRESPSGTTHTTELTAANQLVDAAARSNLSGNTYASRSRPALWQFTASSGCSRRRVRRGVPGRESTHRAARGCSRFCKRRWRGNAELVRRFLNEARLPAPSVIATSKSSTLE